MFKIFTLFAFLALPLASMAYPGDSSDGKQYHSKKLQRLTRQLDLTEQQQAELQTLFDQQREKYRALHEEARERMQQILTPEQLEKLHEIKQEHSRKPPKH